MKNFWLNRKQQWHPTDDMVTLQQLASSDHVFHTYYRHQYVEKEEIFFHDDTDGYFPAKMSKTHILEKSITGKLDGENCIDDGEGNIRLEDGKLVAKINYEAGVLVTTEYVADKELILSYEYDYEKDGTL